MRAIVVDDELLMLKKFMRLSKNIPDLYVAGLFDDAENAYSFVKRQPVEIAFLDVEMPGMNGVELAKKLRELRKDILIVFVSAYDRYIWEFNRIGGDYYLMKPYDEEMLDLAMERIRLIAQRQKKSLYIQTFGRFTVLKEGNPVALSGRAKEILALVTTRRGKEISNEEIYSTIWEERPYDNANMNVFYNALRRLKKALKDENIGNLLISTRHGQMVNTAIFDCDYYDWQDKNTDLNNAFTGEFLSEYSWGEYILADMINESHIY